MDKRDCNILYVDDEVNNLVSFKASFRPFYNIHTALSGQEAIEIMKTENIMVILCDQRMPEMTGIDLLEQLVPEYPDTIRMVMTAYSDVDSIVHAVNKGKIYQYITKPWDPDELKIIIDNAIESYQLKNENKNLLAERTRLQLLNERQQKENILSQLETLKNQVNPHFLFNCLNTLSALVHEDVDAAEKFILKLTNVYRYVLEHKNKLVVKLGDEVSFMRSFFFLQKIRFGDNINLKEEEIPSFLLQYYIPPLAMQLLVENAIKHNVISKNKPLNMEISVAEDQYLVLRNNFQKKETNQSTGIGQYNLRERYSFITNRKPEFFVSEGYYYARIPLIKNHTEIEAYTGALVLD